MAQRSSEEALLWLFFDLLGDNISRGLLKLLKDIRVGRLVFSDPSLLVVVLSVNTHNAGTSETNIVLKSVLNTLDLSLISHSSQLPDQFRALGQASGSQRMSLGD